MTKTYKNPHADLLEQPPHPPKQSLVDMANTVLQIIAPKIQIPNTPENVAYLSRYADLIPVVEKIAVDAYHAIGAEAQYEFEYTKDPESAYEDFFLCVRLCAYAEDFYDLISSINQKYDSELRASEGSFRLTTDFQYPRG